MYTHIYIRFFPMRGGSGALGGQAGASKTIYLSLSLYIYIHKQIYIYIYIYTVCLMLVRRADFRTRRRRLPREANRAAHTLKRT